MNKHAEIVFQSMEYNHGDTTLEGLWVHDKALASPCPSVLVFHQWKGLGPYEKKRAEMMVRLGYNVFAADIYGKNVRPATVRAAAAEAAKFRNDRALFRARAGAALEMLKRNCRSDSHRIAAVGYCFGGMGALELARSGADIAGVVSFHGGLSSPSPRDARHIKAKVLVLHGADDPNVPPEDVAAFEQEMRHGAVDWQLIKYGGAVHAFTDWEAGNDNSKGSAYNERADRRSWEAMQQFFREIFK